MVNILRRFGQPLMLFFTVLIVVSFVVWSPNTGNKSGSSAPAAIIHGKPVTGEAFHQEARVLAIHARLGGAYSRLIDPVAAADLQRDMQRYQREMQRFYLEGRFQKSETPPARPEQKVTQEGVENSLLFESEAAALGITASEQEVKDQLTRTFTTEDGHYNAHQFEMVVKQLLNPEGFNESQIAQFMSSDVRAMKIAGILAAAIPPTPAEIKAEFIRERLLTEASYVAFKAADFRAAQKVTEDEIKKRYEERKEFLKSPEKRKVRFAAFILPPTPEAKPEDEAKKTPKQKDDDEKVKTDKLQKLADAAYDFALALQKPGANFDDAVKTANEAAKAAKQTGPTLGETAEFFSADDAPKELEGSPLAVDAAFELTKEKPHSTHIVLANGTYVLNLKEVQPPEVLPLEKVRKQLEEELTATKADAAMVEKANDIRAKLVEARKNAKSFAEAADTLKVKAEPFPAYSQTQRPPPGAPYARIVINAAAKLAPGEISPMIPGELGEGTALIVHVDQRPAVDEKDMKEATAQIAQRITEQRQVMAFYAWLADRREAAGLKPRKER